MGTRAPMVHDPQQNHRRKKLNSTTCHAHMRVVVVVYAFQILPQINKKRVNYLTTFTQATKSPSPTENAFQNFTSQKTIQRQSAVCIDVYTREKGWAGCHDHNCCGSGASACASPTSSSGAVSGTASGGGGCSAGATSGSFGVVSTPG